VIALYLAASCLVLQITTLAREELQLLAPGTAVPVILLLICFVVPAMAPAESRPRTAARPKPEEVPSSRKAEGRP
jgi:hypothetical protein